MMIHLLQFISWRSWTNRVLRRGDHTQSDLTLRTSTPLQLYVRFLLLILIKGGQSSLREVAFVGHFWIRFWWKRKPESDWCWKRVASRFRAWKRLSDLFEEITAETISESDRRKRPCFGEVKLKATYKVAFDAH